VKGTIVGNRLPRGKQVKKKPGNQWTSPLSHAHVSHCYFTNIRYLLGMELEFIFTSHVRTYTPTTPGRGPKKSLRTTHL
jgi:hypothetical protein